MIEKISPRLEIILNESKLLKQRLTIGDISSKEYLEEIKEVHDKILNGPEELRQEFCNVTEMSIQYAVDLLSDISEEDMDLIIQQIPDEAFKAEAATFTAQINFLSKAFNDKASPEVKKLLAIYEGFSPEDLKDKQKFYKSYRKIGLNK